MTMSFTYWRTFVMTNMSEFDATTFFGLCHVVEACTFVQFEAWSISNKETNYIGWFWGAILPLIYWSITHGECPLTNRYITNRQKIMTPTQQPLVGELRVYLQATWGIVFHSTLNKIFIHLIICMNYSDLTVIELWLGESSSSSTLFGGLTDLFSVITCFGSKYNASEPLFFGRVCCVQFFWFIPISFLQKNMVVIWIPEIN